MDTRTQLENTIIASVLVEGDMYKVCNFLTEKNFTNENVHIWKAIQEVSKTMAVDLITVSYQLRYTHKKEMIIHLTRLTSMVASTENLMFHVACLVQIDLQSKFCAMLLRLAEMKEIDLIERNYLRNAAESIAGENLDIFKAVEGLLNYTILKRFNLYAINRIYAFNESINEKCKSIRENKQKAHLLADLRVLCKTEKAKELLIELKREI